jgi:hypothetical protein
MKTKNAKNKHGKRRDMSGAEAAALQGAPALLVQSLRDTKIIVPRDSPANGLDMPLEPWESRLRIGKELRAAIPRESHAGWTPAPKRPNPVALIKASNAGREKDLIPLRMERMAASPFAFLRGACAVMAWDLSHTPSTGLNVVIDGDCHINNFGLFGTAQGDVVVDLNDFDEATIGPWEWDLKRLTASVNVAGRENGFSKAERRSAVMACAAGYRVALGQIHSIGVVELWLRNTMAERPDTVAAETDKKPPPS